MQRGRAALQDKTERTCYESKMKMYYKALFHIIVNWAVVKTEFKWKRIPKKALLDS